jgi:gentisate 1,2-dioxygenase
MDNVERQATADRSMGALFDALKAKHMGALWQRQADESPPPRPGTYAPFLWRGADVQSLMQWAGEVVRPGPEAERRVLTLRNPGGGTLSAAVQMVLPGEVAPSHRHTPAAIRFILSGSGAATVVDGEPCPMGPGDLMLTPAWSWHGHVSEADGSMIWMDGLDVPIVQALGTPFVFEEYPEGGLQPATKQPGDSFYRFGAAHLRPLWGHASTPVSPLMVYPWRQTEEALNNLAKVDASPFDDVAMEYTNPVTGGHVLPTIGCCVQLLRPGIHTKAHRHTTSAVYQVFKGHGSTIIDGVSFDWGEGDFLRLPPMTWHEHRNVSADAPAILFSITDAPVFEALNLYREDIYSEHDGYQPVAVRSGSGS